MKAQEIFKDRLPNRPYCANRFKDGTHIRSRLQALEYMHIQPCAPQECSWLLFDVDTEWAAYRWEFVRLPEPTVTVVNKANGHAHLLYGLKSPVCLSKKARQRPIDYAKHIKNEYAKMLGADPRYVGLMAKNPFHPHWRTLWHDRLYDLGELGEYLTPCKPHHQKSEESSGRNTSLFDELRVWAYEVVEESKLRGMSFDSWQALVSHRAEMLNAFLVPLGVSEIRSITKSVAKWVWWKYEEKCKPNAEYSLIQARRGKLGGRPRKFEIGEEPWKVEGVSKATYYRYRKK